MKGPSTDRIEKQVLLRASRARVWRALSSAEEFGTWFRVALEGSFAVGKRVRGKITYPGYEHLTMEMLVETMQPEQLFSFRWQPGEDQPRPDGPTTLVEFRLQEADGGTLLTVVESGFDALPPGKRDEAFRLNEQGWTEQMENVRKHVSG